MKNLKHLLTALVFVSLIIFTNCGGGDGGPTPIDPADAQAALFVDSWTLDANGANDGGPRPDLNGLTLEFDGDGDGGDFSTNIQTLISGGLDSSITTVWPASGSWVFTTNIGFIVRSDDLTSDEVTVAISQANATSLILTFTIDTPAARVSGISGDWSFTFSPT